MTADISIIVPVFNEEENIKPLVAEITAAFASLDRDYEIVLVDDASNDGTWAEIQKSHEVNPRVRGLRHTRNAGQSAALWTGFQATSSPIIATLDGDLQNDPADLVRLIAELRDADLICGVRTKRNDSWLRRVSSKVARHARKLALRVDYCDTGCALRVFRRKTLAGLFPFNGLHRFMPILVDAGGWRVKEVPINHRARVAGVSKYGVWNRLWRGVFDLFAIAWYQRRRVGSQPYIDTDEELKTRTHPEYARAA
ncbi:MAG: glycosyltransferase family 2 protein [Verrucomicrobiota bacterium]|nr:glycosyltransferase family 2 protein [Verrucomicrobiota bacterium]